jgi:hypothetical protein
MLKREIGDLVIIQHSSYNRSSKPVASHDITRPTRKSNSGILVLLVRTRSYVTVISTKLTVRSTYIPDLRAAWQIDLWKWRQLILGRCGEKIKLYRPINHTVEFCDFTESSLCTVDSDAKLRESIAEYYISIIRHSSLLVAQLHFLLRRLKANDAVSCVLID